MSGKTFLNSGATGLMALVLSGTLSAQNTTTPSDQPIPAQQSYADLLSDNIAKKFIEFARELKGTLPEKLRTDDFGFYSSFDGQQLGILFNGKKFSYIVKVLPNNEFYFSHENYEIPLTKSQTDSGILGLQYDYFAKSDTGRVYDYHPVSVFKPDPSHFINYSFEKPTAEKLTQYQRDFDAGLTEFMKVIQESIQANPKK